MAKITIENYKDPEDTQDEILYVKGWMAYSPKAAAASLKRVLAGYKAMWPDDADLKNIHIIVLKDGR